MNEKPKPLPKMDEDAGYADHPIECPVCKGPGGVGCYACGVMRPCEACGGDKSSTAAWDMPKPTMGRRSDLRSMTKYEWLTIAQRGAYLFAKEPAYTTGAIARELQIAPETAAKWRKAWTLARAAGKNWPERPRGGGHHRVTAFPMFRPPPERDYITVSDKRELEKIKPPRWYSA